MGKTDKSKQRDHPNRSARPIWVSVLSRIVNGLNAIIYFVIAMLLALMCLLAFLQVIVRLVLDNFGFNLSVPWSEELGRALMIWLVFLGAAYACRTANMIALTFVTDALSQRLQRISDGLAALACISFYGLLVFVGLKATSFGWLEMSPVMQFPKAYVYMSMPIGATLMILNSLTFLVERGMFAKHYNREGLNEIPQSSQDIGS